MQKIINQLAQDISARPAQIQAAVKLLDGGASVPFIARYRKEVTGSLDDTQLRTLQTRLEYLRELEDRRETILKSITEQGKLTDPLRLAILQADSKQTLEDLYLPYKPKRRTKATIAKEAGLEPLADLIWADPTRNPEEEALSFVLKEKTEAGDDFTTVLLVLDGARDILAERWSEDPTVVQGLRSWLWEEGDLASKLANGKNETAPEVAKFQDYFDYQEPINQIPSHRALAVFRGRSLEILDIKLIIEEDDAPNTQTAQKATLSRPEAKLATLLNWRYIGRAADNFLRKVVAWTWRVKLSLSMERELFTRLREDAEKVAIEVFANNLRDLLLAAPAGELAVMGLDPGIRTGVKVAVVDKTGKLLDTATVYPHEPRNDWKASILTLAALCKKHFVNLIAIGNGTASRETDKLAAEVIKLLKEAGQAQIIQKVVISEAGASVYSASEYASQELPNLDVSLRGAVSIARRLQDPLAELVKIDPKSIGVGQYQHDVNQHALNHTLNAVVEDCVNRVGVDLNTASVPLLTRVSGLGLSTAKAIVRWRDDHGSFSARKDLLKVSGLGEKTFEQCAGFLRIREGSNPLDITAVHPESYGIVEKILTKLDKKITEVMGASQLLKTVRIDDIAIGNSAVGQETVNDILAELEKPGRDPRPHFQVARFNEGVNEITDLKIGMVLEGTISNVAGFGAFVDIGAHQDGLIHVSQLANKFVKDAREIVKAGDIVKVQVVELDIPRKRISLTMKIGNPSSAAASSSSSNRRDISLGGGDKTFIHQYRHQQTSNPAGNAMAAAFAKLKR